MDLSGNLSKNQLREQYHKDFEERKLRKQKLQEFINQETSWYERAKMRLRYFCAWLLYRD